ncbi:MAG: L,D-transpeptidase [Kovacikia sp.]
MLHRSIRFDCILLSVGMLVPGAIALAEDTIVQPASSSGEAPAPLANPTGDLTAPAVHPSDNSTAPPANPPDSPSLPPPNPPQDIYSQPGNIINLHSDPSAPPLKQPASPDAEATPDVQLNPNAEAKIRLEIQLSRRRVVMYRGEKVVKSYPIAVGRPGWETPKGTYQVVQKIKDPTWIHPLKKGIVIPGGDPENPLGRYWLGFWTDGNNWIGFHGTPNPGSVGRPVSHGCIRMYNKDVEELFKQVNLGTEVKVIR